MLFEIQAQLASYDGSIGKGDLWRFYDVFYQNLENRSISYFSVIDMTILLLKKHSENERLFYESSSCKMEESLITYYNQLSSAREVSNYVQKMFDLIKEYCRVFWISSILVDQFLAFFSKVVSWLQQNSDSSSISTVLLSLLQIANRHVQFFSQSLFSRSNSILDLLSSSSPSSAISRQPLKTVIRSHPSVLPPFRVFCLWTPLFATKFPSSRRSGRPRSVKP